MEKGMKTPEYKAIKRNYDGLKSSLQQVLGEVTAKCFQEDLIGTTDRDKANNHSVLESVRSGGLVDTILNKIGSHSKWYEVFMKVLEEFTELNDIVRDITTTASESSSTSDDLKTVDDSQLGEADDKPPIPKPKNLIIHQINTLEQRLCNISSSTLDYFLEKKLDVKLISNRVLFLPFSLKREFVANQICDSAPRIKNEKCMIRLFIYLNTLWNFIDYELLEHIIKYHGSHGLQQEMKEYVSELLNFQQRTTIAELIEYWPGRKDIPPTYCNVSAKIKLNPEECTLHRLNKLRKKLTEKFLPPLSDFAMIHHNLIPSSIIVGWAIHLNLIPTLTNKICKHESSSFFETNLIVSFSIRGILVYPLSIHRAGEERRISTAKEKHAASPLEMTYTPARSIPSISIAAKEAEEPEIFSDPVKEFLQEHPEVKFVDRTVFDLNYQNIEPWIDISVLVGYLVKYNIVQNSEDMEELISLRENKRQDWLNSLLKMVEKKEGNDGYMLLYICLRESCVEAIWHKYVIAELNYSASRSPIFLSGYKEEQEEHLNKDKEQQGKIRELKEELKNVREILLCRDISISTLKECQKKDEQMSPKFSFQATDSQLPFVMTNYIQSVVVQGRLYVGGGVTQKHAERQKIMYYDIVSEKWDQLPESYGTIYFAMAAISEQLVLVGGWKLNPYDIGEPIKFLGVWDETSWTHPYPHMPTARCGCSAIVYNEWLIVAGGVVAPNKKESTLDCVEVLNTDSRQWYTGAPTLKPLYCMKTAIAGDKGYFMGGTDETGWPDITNVYQVDVRKLIQNLSILTQNLSIGEKEYNEIWQEIPPPSQLYGSTPVSVNEFLLAVGGVDKNDKPVTAIHLYQPADRKWVVVGELPNSRPRRLCTCAMITNSKLLVAGGEITRTELLQEVDFAVIA